RGKTMRRILVGVSGASGMPLAQHLLRALYCTANIEVHLIISAGAQAVLAAETLPLGPIDTAGASVDSASETSTLLALTQFAHVVHDSTDIGAGPASGSWQHGGMVLCPCSMASLACIATGAGYNLVHRAADVCLKERRPLVVVARETPLSSIHLRNMLTLSRAGACIMPPCPAFYGRPQSIADILEHFTGRILDQFGIAHALGHRWQEAE
ncbi:MAG: UbiX family flavin prenyltransferase, partial [Desulfovibrionaceae bacterium]